MKKQDIDIDKLKQLYETTSYTLTEIGNQLGCSYDIIKNRIKIIQFQCLDALTALMTNLQVHSPSHNNN